MSDATTHDLVQRVKQLLEPGDIELTGVIVQTRFTSDDEIELYDVTLDIGDCIASHAGVDEWYVYSGNDDPEFGLNQHQGLTLDTDEFVWECQQLLRDGTFDIVVYYEATADHDGIVRSLRSHGYDVIGVTPDDKTSTPKS